MASILWFRHGLRLHDNPALLEALKKNSLFLPIFIFDGESAGTNVVGYNRMKFLLESLNDIDCQLRGVGGRLLMVRGDPVQIFSQIHQAVGVYKISFEQDCEPIWKKRDDAVKNFCEHSGIAWKEFVSHTLWDPRAVIATNNGTPPLTYQIFLYIARVLGNPDRPLSDPDWSGVRFMQLSDQVLSQINTYALTPTPEDFGLHLEAKEQILQWVGGERQALTHLKDRLNVEKDAFKQGIYLPNHNRPDLLGPPTSQSPALRFGCLSVRRFYWMINDLYDEVHKGELPSNVRICGQLIWRDYFYTMSVNNPFYAEMARNPICIDIKWQTNSEHLEAWKDGRTGYPFIDAVMRQLKSEGWIHQVARNAVASFLTRGVLWISWEEGLKHFLRYLLDADWSVCAGNWMWVSSSAFEKLLDSSDCVCPVSYGRRFDPWGEYIRRYIPELRNLPNEYLYEPWKAPLDVQERAGAIIGREYPQRIVDHQACAARNRQRMDRIREALLSDNIPHCAPSNQNEVVQIMCLPEDCMLTVMN